MKAIGCQDRKCLCDLFTGNDSMMMERYGGAILSYMRFVIEMCGPPPPAAVALVGVGARLGHDCDDSEMTPFDVSLTLECCYTSLGYRWPVRRFNQLGYNQLQNANYSTRDWETAIDGLLAIYAPIPPRGGSAIITNHVVTSLLHVTDFWLGMQCLT